MLSGVWFLVGYVIGVILVLLFFAGADDDE